MQQTFKDFGSFKDFVASRTLELINYARYARVVYKFESSRSYASSEVFPVTEV
jgi:hypothetical protein